jgi:hypothetical protein
LAKPNKTPFNQQGGKPMMSGGIFSWLIIGLVIYFIFSRRGGMMGCCGGHNHNSPEHGNHAGHQNGHWKKSQEDIIDLKKEDYRVSNKA